MHSLTANSEQQASVAERRSAQGAASPQISIIVTCKGRLNHLLITLESMLSQRCNYAFEVVIVDYACPNCTFDCIKRKNVQGVVALKVEPEVAHFNLSHARNCGASAAAGQVLAFVDADIRLLQGWLEHVSALILSGKYGLMCVSRSSDNRWDRFGTCAVSRHVYEEVRGYDERLTGWGCEDNDFYTRCRAKTGHGQFAAGWLAPISHNDDHRVQFYISQSLRQSAQLNASLINTRSGAVNPSGYGEANTLVHCGNQVHTWRGYAPNLRFRRPVREVRSSE